MKRLRDISSVPWIIAYMFAATFILLVFGEKIPKNLKDFLIITACVSFYTPAFIYFFQLLKAPDKSLDPDQTLLKRGMKALGRYVAAFTVIALAIASVGWLLELIK